MRGPEFSKEKNMKKNFKTLLINAVLLAISVACIFC